MTNTQPSPVGLGPTALENVIAWQGSVRALAPAQIHHFQWHLLRLEDGCRRSRFGSPTSDAFLREYGERVDGSNTVVLGYFVDGHWSGKAEIAFSVEKAWQGMGIGTALMAAVIEAARIRGIGTLYLTCHTLNRWMQRVAEGVAAKIGFENCECFAEIDVTAHQEQLALAS